MRASGVESRKSENWCECLVSFSITEIEDALCYLIRLSLLIVLTLLIISSF